MICGTGIGISIAINRNPAVRCAPVSEPVSARFAYVRTMLGILEMLKQGVTAVHDDAFFIPVPTDAEVDSVMHAYRDSGMRATMTLERSTFRAGQHGLLVVIELHAAFPTLLWFEGTRMRPDG